MLPGQCSHEESQEIEWTVSVAGFRTNLAADRADALKERSCRVALLRMEKDGLLRLPPPLRNNGCGNVPLALTWPPEKAKSTLTARCDFEQARRRSTPSVSAKRGGQSRVSPGVSAPLKSRTVVCTLHAFRALALQRRRRDIFEEANG
jgi:hypothetical protein